MCDQENHIETAFLGARGRWCPRLSGISGCECVYGYCGASAVSTKMCVWRKLELELELDRGFYTRLEGRRFQEAA